MKARQSNDVLQLSERLELGQAFLGQPHTVEDHETVLSANDGHRATDLHRNQHRHLDATADEPNPVEDLSKPAMR
jgi:hypothetical protein